MNSKTRITNVQVDEFHEAINFQNIVFLAKLLIQRIADDFQILRFVEQEDLYLVNHRDVVEKENRPFHWN